jgi:hypothetical protein
MTLRLPSTPFRSAKPSYRLVHGLAILGFITIVSPVSPVAAELKYENVEGGSALIYGQFNPAFLTFDDGVSTTGNGVDNGNSNSRVGLWLRNPTGADGLSFNFETALGFRQSFLLSQINTPPALDWERTDIRKIDLSLRTETAGTFSVGQGSMATDGVAESDFSGTTLVTYSSIFDTAAAFQFSDEAGNLSDIRIAGAFPNFDGNRLGRFRYDTPSLNGFIISASYGKNILAEDSIAKTGDLALRYSNEIDDIKFKGAIGYSRTNLATGTDPIDTFGSFGLIHSSGFNFLVAAGHRQGEGNYGYGKLGYKTQWFSAGITAMSIDTYVGSDMTSTGSDSNSVGFGLVQSFDKIGVDAYLGYRNYRLSEVTMAYRDASSVLFGARWKY